MKEIILRTKRLRLRRISLSDAENMLSYRSDPEIFKFQNFKPGTIDHVIDFINRCSLTPNIEGSWYQLGVFLNDELIGDCGLHFLGPDNSQVELGYTIARRHQRKGYGEECVVSILEYLFGELRKHRVIASLDPENEPSMRLMQKLGFRREGWFRKSILVGAEWEDDVIYAILEEEWMNRRRKN